MKRPLWMCAVLAFAMLACVLPGGLTGETQISPSAAPTLTEYESATSTPDEQPAGSATQQAPSASPEATVTPPQSPWAAGEPISRATVPHLLSFVRLAGGQSVRGVAFSADNSLLAAALGDEQGLIRTIDLSTGETAWEVKAHQSIIWGLASSPDGRWLASASKDRTAKIWDWQSGALVQTLELPDEVTSVAFSPDASLLAAGGVEAWPDAAIRIYGTRNWTLREKLSEYWNIPAIAFSPDGQLLVGGGTSRNVGVWQVADGSLLHTLYHSGQVSSLAVSPNGSQVVTGLCQTAAEQSPQCLSGAIWVWSLGSGQLVKKLSDFPDWVEAVAFSRDGSAVLAGSRDGTLRAYSYPGLEPILELNSPSGPAHYSILSLAASPDGKLLASGGAGGIMLWGIGP